MVHVRFLNRTRLIELRTDSVSEFHHRLEIEEVSVVVKSTGRVRHRIPGGESRPTETQQRTLPQVVAEVEIDLCAEIVIGDGPT